MKKIGWILMLLLAAPAMAATKMNVEQLKQALAEMKQGSKSDEDVAARLKEVQLTEELTHSAKTSLTPYLPGDLSTEQMFILEGRSAFMPPPAEDTPTSPAPDAAAQKDILAKAADYLSKTYDQLPPFSASKTISRYQDDLINTSSSPGLTVNTVNSFARLSDADTKKVESEKGIEKLAEKDKTPWGENGRISPPGLMPSLSVLFQEASEGERSALLAGKLSKASARRFSLLQSTRRSRGMKWRTAASRKQTQPAELLPRGALRLCPERFSQ